MTWRNLMLPQDWSPRAHRAASAPGSVAIAAATDLFTQLKEEAKEERREEAGVSRIVYVGPPVAFHQAACVDPEASHAQGADLEIRSIF